jgi:hypothetical protein
MEKLRSTAQFFVSSGSNGARTAHATAQGCHFSLSTSADAFREFGFAKQLDGAAEGRRRKMRIAQRHLHRAVTKEGLNRLHRSPRGGELRREGVPLMPTSA